MSEASRSQQDYYYYCSQENFNIYDSAELNELATQMAKGRGLRVLADLADSLSNRATSRYLKDSINHEERTDLTDLIDGANDQQPIQVQLLEDAYVGYLTPIDWHKLSPIASGQIDTYRPIERSRAEIKPRISGAIAFAQAAMQCPNQYLWGGTVAPDYDCSGLVQAAFASVGIQLPRDAYQQEAFLESIPIAKLEPGDLIFFGNRDRANHVAIYLGEGQYIHSSGRDNGRNGIAIDALTGGDAIAQRYAAQVRGAGRINRCYLGIWEQQHN
jgi:cell wall-associated NlpC family hydrolase